jgi:23S rRNA (cytidine1920-2'-O)/16S rRNA (cytidine1409-2'-O)-methyltransferase
MSARADRSVGSANVPRRRIDHELVERGLFETRAKAQAAIAAGRVSVEGKPVRKPSQIVAAEAEIAAEPAHPYVSRGGLKLAHGLQHFGLSATGRICLDVGASTGGFTDVLLRDGAARIYAVDSGRDQLHLRLRKDPRVVLRESLDIRTATRKEIPEPASLAVIDVSFISLRFVLPSLPRFLATGAEIVALIKPQFEVGRKAVGRGGIVRDAAARQACVGAITTLMAELGFMPSQPIVSPIAGGDGNEEWLAHALWTNGT